MEKSTVSERNEVLFIGGRSGVGKTSLAAELHYQLSALRIKHAVIEGDNLDLAYPPPWKYGLAEQNLKSIWGNYRALGYRRLIYTNTVSVLHTGDLMRAIGEDSLANAVLLTASDGTARLRLEQREIGAGLETHLERSSQRAAELDERTPAWVNRICTDERPVQELAAEVLALLNWNETP
ncbi:hypothetical protein FNU79_07610 [Deinococcus detaillensis]|uniref:Adenylyl-sulfate kinase n=1 Tax=Deinococcus detaillensis TaxID=2592048 RepID=A0A553V212_9DEIO|nr:ATP-binding protein [Deinococcus detaillensis]TSA86498.1 hypothetical protein FNU79_07610 [Deinococcus detaillensis]